MKSENPFRRGDHVVFVGKKRHRQLNAPVSIHPKGFREVRNNGIVQRIWRKGWRHMVDVHFPYHGDFVCYPEELQFAVLDTLGAM
jgi:hypothetical protein